MELQYPRTLSVQPCADFGGKNIVDNDEAQAAGHDQRGDGQRDERIVHISRQAAARRGKPHHIESRVAVG